MTAPKLAVAAVLALLGGACTPSIPKDPLPEAMEFDPQAVPPRAPTPTGLVIDPTTKHINLALANMAVPADCTAPPPPLSQAECEFDTYLQSLDGFPTVTPGLAPATAALAPATLTVGTNVVVVAATSGQLVTDVTTGFDATTTSLTVHPRVSWKVGESYWLGVRGYTNGVRAADGTEVVGSPIMALLKQDTSLTCGAATPAAIDGKCPAVALLEQSIPKGGAANAYLLEQIRLAYLAGNGWGFMAANGLPKDEVAVLWGFPVHTTSVPELDPTVGLVPRVTSATQLRVGVQGPVDPTTVSAFAIGGGTGSSVLVLDLDALLANDLAGGFPHVTAHFEAGDIVIDATAPFVAGHQYGVFMRRELHDDRGRSLVASPVSKLLTLRGTLVNAAGKSTISSVADADATQLEAGRQQLATLFDNPMLAALTAGWLNRDELIYCFAFPLKVGP